MLRDRKLPVSGNKEELVSRILHSGTFSVPVNSSPSYLEPEACTFEVCLKILSFCLCCQHSAFDVAAAVMVWCTFFKLQSLRKHSPALLISG
jgi:hypothetical protein